MFVIMLNMLGNMAIATIMLDLINDLGTGALNGLVAGAIAGAIVWAISQAPDVLGRVLLLVIVLALLMLFVQLALILNVLPEISMNAIIVALQDRSTLIGSMIVDAGRWIGLAALAGALLAVLFTVPGDTIKGGLIGVGLGALLGAALHAGARELGVNLQAGTILFQLVVGLLTGGVLTSIGGR